MRVISGKYRGRQLKGPKHQGLRPTADRVKEALFNILGSKVVEADFLDLFAGTGGIGIEAISRGARSVFFADQNNLSIRLIEENIRIIKPDEPVRVVNLSAERALSILAKENSTFDLIFLDPPFEAGLLEKTIQKIIEFQLIKEDGIIIAEHPRKLEFSFDSLNSLTRNYGDISLTFFSKKEH